MDVLQWEMGCLNRVPLIICTSQGDSRTPAPNLACPEGTAGLGCSQAGSPFLPLFFQGPGLSKSGGEALLSLKKDV